MEGCGKGNLVEPMAEIEVQRIPFLAGGAQIADDVSQSLESEEGELGDFGLEEYVRVPTVEDDSKLAVGFLDEEGAAADLRLAFLDVRFRDEEACR